MTGTVANATDILHAMLDRYASLRSYQDEGLVRVWLPGDVPPLELRFRTWYAAPGRYRFELASPHPHPTLRRFTTQHIAGSDGTRAYALTRLHGERPESRTHRTLGLAMAGVSGVSCGAVQTVAQLAMPSLHGVALRDLEDLRVAGELSIAGIVYTRIAGTHPRGGPYELAIGKDDPLLHRLTKRSANRPIEEVRRDIAVNQTIADGVFEAPR